jgi:hypothetical protein
MHIRQSALNAVVVKRQTLVINAEQVQNGGVEIVNIDRILGSLPADVVGRSVRDAALQARAGQANGEGVWIVVAPGGQRWPTEYA